MNLDNVAADRLLGLIKRRGPQRGADLAVALGITPEAVRQQLLRLAEMGLVEAAAERGAAGRPARRWSLTRAGHDRFPDTHDELTVALIEAVRAEFGEAALERLIARREAETLRRYTAALAQESDLPERVAALAALRSAEGYMAESWAEGDGVVLVENHCPICAAASVCQGFCRAELEIFAAALGPAATVERTEHLTLGARRCAYRITPREAVP